MSSDCNGRINWIPGGLKCLKGLGKNFEINLIFGTFQDFDCVKKI